MAKGLYMRTIILTLALLLIAPALPAQAQEISRVYGMTLGEKLPLNSKQVQGMAAPGQGLERYMLLFVPAPRPPFARYWATTDINTGRVVRITAQTRTMPTADQSWKTFHAQIEKLESKYGAGMRVGGGSIWRLVRQGRSIELRLNPTAKQLRIQYADEFRMTLGHPK